MLARVIGIACLSLALLMAGQVRAEEPESDPFEGRLLPLELVMSFRKQIDLSRKQNKRIGELVVEMQRAVAERQWQMQSTYFELQDALDEDVIDEDRALGLVKAAVDAENEIKQEQIRLLIRVRNLLEPEQIAYLRKQLDNGWTES